MIDSKGISLITPRFGFGKISNNGEYGLYKLRQGLLIDENNVKIENYEIVKKFCLFSELPKKYQIEIFESEYNDWVIDRLEKLYPYTTIGFNINEQIVLKICMSFPETFYKLKNHKNVWNKKQDGNNFREGCFLIGIGNSNRDIIDNFYKNVRCELYHFGSIKGNRYIDYERNEAPSSIIYKKGELNCINLGEFIKRIRKCMVDYVSELKVNDKLYQIFLENYVKDLDSYLK